MILMKLTLTWSFDVSGSLDKPWVLDHSREEQGLGDRIREQE